MSPKIFSLLICVVVIQVLEAAPGANREGDVRLTAGDMDANAKPVGRGEEEVRLLLNDKKQVQPSIASEKTTDFDLKTEPKPAPTTGKHADSATGLEQVSRIKRFDFDAAEYYVDVEVEPDVKQMGPQPRANDDQISPAIEECFGRMWFGACRTKIGEAMQKYGEMPQNKFLCCSGWHVKGCVEANIAKECAGLKHNGKPIDAAMGRMMLYKRCADAKVKNHARECGGTRAQDVQADDVSEIVSTVSTVVSVTVVTQTLPPDSSALVRSPPNKWFLGILAFLTTLMLKTFFFNEV